MLKKYETNVGLLSATSGQDSAVYVFLNVEIKPSVSTRRGEYYVYLRHCQILRNAVLRGVLY
jgi:hypothetical protein